MAKNTVWQDDYYLMLMQLFLRKPVGVKPMFSRDMVGLSLEVHIAPQELQRRMQQIATLDTPRIERIWRTYSDNPRRLARAVRLLREMKGFGAAADFYEGVEVQETFERDFRPLDENKQWTPVMLIMVLDLYFRLTPQTMVAETPEVVELARQMKTDTAEIVEVLEVYQHCDPYLNRQDMFISTLMLPCQQVWQRFTDKDPNQLAALATELSEYFK